MKLELFSILATSMVSAEWGLWLDGMYCDISQPVLGEIYSENPAYKYEYCEDFCA